MALLTVEVEEFLARHGISREEALADLLFALPMPETSGDNLFLAGDLAVYECERRRVFGRDEILVVKAFIPDEQDED